MTDASRESPRYLRRAAAAKYLEERWPGDAAGCPTRSRRRHRRRRHRSRPGPASGAGVRSPLAPLVGRGPPALGRWIGRGEAHHLGEVERAEQHHRVEVAVAEPEAEVQHAVAMVIAAVTLVGRAAGGGDRVAALDHVAGVHGDRRKEGVRRAETAGVGDGDVQRARDRAGERNLAAVGGPDRHRGRRRSRRRDGRSRTPTSAPRMPARRGRRRDAPTAWARRVGPGWLVGARDVDGQGEDEGDDEHGDEAPRR